ncbi:hypothetical protein CCACVL1_05002 [Corchorus capsularis]|uniref:Uncharacterized protein n=1 Tax=Corchorus capsularis TaxID=210143 RepID=A0A1R3JN99_COCAP|nr:hypothetical protein CCACVL1_05002 [Corchorus capsularis]
MREVGMRPTHGFVQRPTTKPCASLMLPVHG